MMALIFFTTHHFHIDHNAPPTTPPPPQKKKKIGINIVSNFSWVLQSISREIEANGHVKFGGKQGALWSL